MSACDTLPHSISSAVLRLGELEVKCHLLSDGQRVLAAEDALRLLGAEMPASADVRRWLQAIPA